MDTNGDWAAGPSDALPTMHIDREVSLTKPATIKVYDYWRARRGNRVVPLRKDIHPKDLKAYIGQVGLIEVKENDKGVDYLVRLAGSRLEEVMGPITGKLFSECLPSAIEVRWRMVCDEVRRSGGPLSVSGRVAHERRFWLQAEVFVGPLADENGKITQLLLGAETWSAPTGAPEKVPA